MDNYFIFHENDATPGIRTDHKVRLQSDDMLLDHTRAETIYFYKHMVTTSESKTPADMKAILLGQMGNMQEFTKTDIRGNETRIITGIHNKDTKTRIKGRKDDLQRALSLTIYSHARRLKGEPKCMNWGLIEAMPLKRHQPLTNYDRASQRKRMKTAEERMYKFGEEADGVGFADFRNSLRNQHLAAEMDFGFI